MADRSGVAKRRTASDRVVAACDLCKQRKVKCSGTLPCDYCIKRHQPESCVFTSSRIQKALQAVQNIAASELNGINPTALEDGTTPTYPRENAKRRVREDMRDPAVPLEARLLQDTGGKTIFIGDCAPISFLHAVERLIASKLELADGSLQITRKSIVEITPNERVPNVTDAPSLDLDKIDDLVNSFLTSTSAIVDLFNRDTLLSDMQAWAEDLLSEPDEVVCATRYLILAVGAQEKSHTRAEEWFHHAKDVLIRRMPISMNVATVQGFTLVAIYLLRASQPNGSYLHFSLAARVAYTIGLHRKEVNSTFGKSAHMLRSKVWRSLRVVDMLISLLLARPPATSGSDCTVPYTCDDLNVDESPLQLLESNVALFLIIEGTILEVYSRKRISLHVANVVSHQLKQWASMWLRPLTEIACSEPGMHSEASMVGSCQILMSYFYGIILLTRPFLIYNIYENTGATASATGARTINNEKMKFSNAALDAASTLILTLHPLIRNRMMPLRMPLVISWLFTACLVLLIGLLGRDGESLKKNCELSLECLSYFASADPQALQYRIIAQGLFNTILHSIDEQEAREKSLRQKASSNLFGLLLHNPDPNVANLVLQVDAQTQGTESAGTSPSGVAVCPASESWDALEADFFTLPWLDHAGEESQDWLFGIVDSADQAV